MAPDGSADTATVRGLIAALGSMAPALDDADRIERVRLLEELKSVAAAAQAVEARDFDVSQRAAQAVAGEPASRQGRGVASQIALARRVSPWAAQRWLGWAAIVTRELPETFAALASGRITEWRATLIARETACLSREDRAVVDAELAPYVEGWGDRRVEAEAKRAAYRLDPHAVMARVRGADKDRRVTLRPAPDAMARLTALVPVAQGVAAYAALCRTADTTTAGGDERGRGQIMADTLVQRVTGQATADSVPVEIELLMTERALLARPGDPGSDEPAELLGYGPVPAGLARELALGSDVGTPRWIRRLLTDPLGRITAVDPRRREFTPAQRRHLRFRDRTCRIPWCDAPMRHADHVRAHADRGPTTIDNGEGLCEACNHAKQAPGWRSRPHPDGTVTIRTPTGHHYEHTPPDLPGLRLRTRTRTVELIFHAAHAA